MDALTPQQYLTQLYQAFCAGKKDQPKSLTIFVSHEFHKQYEMGLTSCSRFYQSSIPTGARLLFKTAQVRPSNVLNGHEVHFLEDIVVWGS